MQTATQETGGPQGLTEEQGVSELLSRWSKREEAAKAEVEQPEQTQETEEEQPEGDVTPEAEEVVEEPADGEVEIDVGGAKFKAPAALKETMRSVEAKVKEIEAGATRKFQEAADLRKAVEIQTQSVAQLQKIAEVNADLLADHRMVVRRMQQIEGVDINNTDAETLTRLNTEFNQLNAAKGRIEAQYAQNVTKWSEEGQKAMQAKREHAEKVLATQIKGWSPEYGKKLAEYAINRGAPVEALNGITDAWMVQILDDAAYGYAMRQKSPQVLNKVKQAPKTLPSGSAATKSATTTKADEAFTRLRKSGSIQDAALALLARSQAKRK